MKAEQVANRLSQIAYRLLLIACCLLAFSIHHLPASEIQRDFSPKPQEQQLPRAMHSAMKELPRITVGKDNAEFPAERGPDLIGSDNRVLQAAVDYVAGLGGGTVEIGDGEYIMRDSLHLPRFSILDSRYLILVFLHEHRARPEPGRRTSSIEYRAFGTVIQGCLVDIIHGLTRISSLCPLCSLWLKRINKRRNGTDGLFLCWRVRHGLFEDNLLEGNGRFGISIGHKDSDNLLRRNIVRLNRCDGVFLRDEPLGMAAHYNRLEENIIENNGSEGQAAGICIRGQTNDLVFKNNTIRDTRPKGSRTQTVGIRIEKNVGKVILQDNRIDAETNIDDRRVSQGK